MKHFVVSLVSKYFTLIIILLIFSFFVLPRLINPFFFGDSGLRLNFANSVIVHAGNRVWLPFLQIHIYIIHLLKLPLFAYLLIPLGYGALSIIFIYFASIQILNKYQERGLISFLLLFTLISNHLFFDLTTNFYQEIIMFCLFTISFVLYIKQKNRSIMFVLIICLGLLTREYVWIYLIVFIGGTTLKEKIQWYLLPPSVIPVIWLMISNQSPMLSINNDGWFFSLPHMISQVSALINMLSEQSLVLPYILTFLAYVVIYFQHNRELSKDTLLIHYTLFSLVSLTLIYGYIIILNPWMLYPDSERIVFPLFLHLYFWILIAFRHIHSLERSYCYVVLIFILIALYFLADGFRTRSLLSGSTYIQSHYFQEMKPIVSQFKKNHQIHPYVAVAGLSYWDDYIPYFPGQFLYVPTFFYESVSPYGYPGIKFLFAPEGSEVIGFTKNRIIILPNGRRVEVLEEKPVSSP